MPDTRALFESLVRDRPPVRLDVAAIERRAEATIRRRRALAGVCVLAAVGSLALGIAGQHQAASEPAGPSAPTGLAFASAEQMQAADRRVVNAMLSAGGPGAKVTQSTPGHISGSTRRTIHEVSYQKDGATVTLLENVSAPSGAGELANMGITGKDQNSPCAAPHHAPATQADGSVVTWATSIQCVGQPLSDGATLWTFITHWGDSAPDSPPNAVVEEPDGSTVFVQTSAVNGAAALDREHVGTLAVALEQAWKG